ncbi:MAG: hypothetical protein HC830_07310 [Bacteroidetes bacterium]|nr:hypothetical protein [Bacteroidota bacterium]
MIIDTQKSRIRIQLQKLLFLFLLVLFWVFLYTTTYFKQPVLGLERNYYAGAAALLYVLYYTAGYLRDANYIYFNNNSSKIIIRYFP